MCSVGMKHHQFIHEQTSFCWIHVKFNNYCSGHPRQQSKIHIICLVNHLTPSYKTHETMYRTINVEPQKKSLGVKGQKGWVPPPLHKPGTFLHVCFSGHLIRVPQASISLNNLIELLFCVQFWSFIK